MKFQNFFKFVVSITLFASTSMAQEWPKCSGIGEVEKMRDYYSAQAEAIKPAVEAMQDLANDHKRINQIAAGLAVASSTGLALVTYRGLDFYGAGRSYSSFVKFNPITSAYFRSAYVRLKAGMAAGVLIAFGSASTAVGIAVTVPLVVILPALTVVEVGYPFAMGAYQLVTDHGTIEIKEAEVKDGELAIKKSLSVISDMKKQILANPPDAIKDSLKFGGSNSDYMGKLAVLTRSEMNHWQMLASVKDLQVKMLKSSCAGAP
jgi:hypothetical protein